MDSEDSCSDPSVFRVAMKLLRLQKRCCLDVVCVRHITAAFSVGGGVKQEVELNRQEVSLSLNRMFLSVSQEVEGHVTERSPGETCQLLFSLYESPSSLVSSVSLQAALIALTAETPTDKYGALVRLSADVLGSVSRSGLRCLLQDLSQLPAAVQEGEVPVGSVEAAVSSCFNKVSTPTAAVQHVLSWLQTEPCLLLWLPALHRVCISQNVCHNVRCHTCKTIPITGLRFRCMKCVNVHVCQSCFLFDRQTKKHKSHHPLRELHTQPTWRESWSSLLHRARHTLLLGRRSQRECDRRRVLMWAEPAETTNRAPPPPNASSGLVASSYSNVSHHASGRPHSCSFSSKCLQTEEEPTSQQGASALLSDVRDLQRDKWLLEEQLQAWKLTAQSERSILEDRCTEMEVTMETLRGTHLHLQDMLTQALRKIEAHHLTGEETDARRNAEEEREEDTDGGGGEGDGGEDEEVEEEEEEEDVREEETDGGGGEGDGGEDEEVEEEEEEEEEEDVREETEEDFMEEEENPSPTMHQDTAAPQHTDDDEVVSPPMGLQDGAGEAEPCGVEDCGKCSLEELLQDTVDRLRNRMQTSRCAQRQTGERKEAGLLEAAVQVGQSIGHLVDAVRTN